MVKASFLRALAAKMTLFYFLFSILLFTHAQQAYLIVQHQEQTLLELPLSQTPTWMLRWNHSVTGVTVTDYYYWSGSEMLLTDTHTPAFDAGLGHIPDRGRLASDGMSGYFIFDIDEAVPTQSYILRVGSKRVNHRIDHAGQSYSLSDVAQNQRVTIQVVLK